MAIDAVPVVLRPARTDEYDAALAIQHRAYTLKEAPLYGGPLNPGAIESRGEMDAMLAKGYTLMAGEYGGKLAGSMRIKPEPDGSVYLCRVSVDPDLHGRGIAQRMILALEQLFPAAPTLHLDVGDKSEENIYLYKKLGFVFTGDSHQVPNGPLCLDMRKTVRNA